MKHISAIDNIEKARTNIASIRKLQNATIKEYGAYLEIISINLSIAVDKLEELEKKINNLI